MKRKFANGQKTYDLTRDYLTYFFKDGTIKAEGEYRNDKMEGEWKFYRKTGDLWQVGNFANGIYFVKAGGVVKKVVKE